MTAFGFFILPRLVRREGEITRNSGLMSIAAAILAVSACGVSIVVAPLVLRLIFGYATAVALILLIPLSVQLVFEAAASGFSLPLQVTQRGAAIAAAAHLASVAVGVPAVVWRRPLAALSSRYGRLSDKPASTCSRWWWDGDPDSVCRRPGASRRDELLVATDNDSSSTVYDQGNSVLRLTAAGWQVTAATMG
jgi:hypothetical protein